MAEKYGMLYICATPIGNLGDITIRALETLKSVDFIAAEDTRHTLKLLNHYGIKKKLISYHEHNKLSRWHEIIAFLKDGKNGALVSDAGMPVISDPGEHIIAKCREESICVTVCPGASASLAALVLSGIEAERFVFEGFLPKAKKQRKNRLESLKDEERTIILYESPHHLKQTLKDLFSVFGDREISVARELTKIHEEVIGTSISGAIDIFDGKEPRGEFVLIIKGNKGTEHEAFWNDLTVSEHVKHYENEGAKEMDAIKLTARDRGVSKSTIYAMIKK